MNSNDNIHESMNTPREATAVPVHRLLYWQVRRELWENRSIYIAPLAVAGVMLLGFLVSTGHLPELALATAGLPPDQETDHLIKVYGMVSVPLILVALAVGMFYCLDALNNERRDRSILFWKSLPVSDLLTVASKAAIPMLVLPLLTFVIVVVLQNLMRVITSVVLLAHGLPVADLWTQLPLLHLTVLLFYALAVLALWHAPVYAWLLLVSAWAKRSTFLVAVVPPMALGLAEKIAFGSHHVFSLIGERLFGGVGEAFAFERGRAVSDPLLELDPARFIASPGLWLGLLAAAGLFYGAVMLRRSRQPL